MADTKLTALTAFTPIVTDLLYGVDNPAGTPVSGKMTISALWTLLLATAGERQAALDFADSVKAKFGSGDDLEIYHDGSNSYISHVGTGELRINDVKFTDSITETEYNLTGTAIDPSNGTIQYKTLTANTTFTESVGNGQYVLLMIDDGTAYTVTWPTITWLTNSGSAPTLATSGYTSVLVFQMNGTLYGVSLS